jgi:hypothetical protein
MNTIKQTISKKFARKYCSKVESKVEPDNQFIEKCVGVWTLWVTGCAIGGGIYGAYRGYECVRLGKNYEKNVRLLVPESCCSGIIEGAFIGVFGPCVAIGYVASAIKSKME